MIYNLRMGRLLWAVIFVASAVERTHAYKCYNIPFCNRDNCLSSFAGADTCEASSYGCQMTYIESTSSKLLIAECAKTECSPASVLNENSKTIVHCCGSDMCNNGLPNIQLGSVQQQSGTPPWYTPFYTPYYMYERINQCYNVLCKGDNCLKEAIDNKMAVPCPMNSVYGCSLNIAETQRDGTTYIAQCSSSACTPAAVLGSGTATLTYCCDSDLCNTGIPRTQKGSNQCYNIICSGEKCLEDAIANNKVVSCPMDEQYGCAVSAIHRTTSAVGVTGVIAQCASSSVRCAPGSISRDGSSYTSTCCKSDLCNNITPTIGGVNNLNGLKTHVMAVIGLGVLLRFII